MPETAEAPFIPDKFNMNFRSPDSIHLTWDKGRKSAFNG